MWWREQNNWDWPRPKTTTTWAKVVLTRSMELTTSRNLLKPLKVKFNNPFHPHFNKKKGVLLFSIGLCSHVCHWIKSWWTTERSSVNGRNSTFGKYFFCWRSQVFNLKINLQLFKFRFNNFAFWTVTRRQCTTTNVQIFHVLSYYLIF